MKNWFEVDRHGLAQILERKGKEFVLFELIQNGWDEPGVTEVSVTLDYLGRNKARLVVEDDAPDGFKDPSDPEANKLAVSQGYTVVHGGMMSSAAWQNAKTASAILPAGVRLFA